MTKHNPIQQFFEDNRPKTRAELKVLELEKQVNHLTQELGILRNRIFILEQKSVPYGPIGPYPYNPFQPDKWYPPHQLFTGQHQPVTTQPIVK